MIDTEKIKTQINILDLARDVGLDEDAIKELSQSIGLGQFSSQKQQDMSDVLGFLANLAHENLLNSENKSAFNYLKDNRGLSEKTIKEYKLGYIKNGWKVLNRLKEKYSFEQLEKAGLIAENNKTNKKYLIFYKCIVFPYLKGNRVVYMTSRGFPKKSHRKLVGIDCDYIYCEDLCQKEQVILTEGEIDCLTVRQVGLNAWGIPGAESFKDSWIKRLKRFKLKFILFDQDESGQKAAMKIAEKIDGRITYLDWHSPRLKAYD